MEINQVSHKFYRPISRIKIGEAEVDYLEMGACQTGLLLQAFIEAQRSLTRENQSDSEVFETVINILSGIDGTQQTRRDALIGQLFIKPQAYAFIQQVLEESFPKIPNISDLRDEFKGELVGYLLDIFAKRMIEQSAQLMKARQNEIALPVAS